MIAEFIERAKEYDKRCRGGTNVRAAFFKSLGLCRAARQWDVESLWQENWQVFTALGIGVLVAATAVAVARGSKK